MWTASGYRLYTARADYGSSHMHNLRKPNPHTTRAPLYQPDGCYARITAGPADTPGHDFTVMALDTVV